MGFISELKNFMLTLTFVDFVFFFAVIMLLILIITLIYFIKINEDILRRDLQSPLKPKSELELINEAIKKGAEEKISQFSDFEEEQEEKAIISYDELKKNNKSYELNYSEEKEVDGLKIKKINIDDAYSTTEYKPSLDSVRVISYQKEEEFLETLKRLQTLLR